MRNDIFEVSKTLKVAKYLINKTVAEYKINVRSWLKCDNII